MVTVTSAASSFEQILLFLSLNFITIEYSAQMRPWALQTLEDHFLGPFSPSTSLWTARIKLEARLVHQALYPLAVLLALVLACSSGWELLRRQLTHWDSGKGLCRHKLTHAGNILYSISVTKRQRLVIHKEKRIVWFSVLEVESPKHPPLRSLARPPGRWDYNHGSTCRGDHMTKQQRDGLMHYISPLKASPNIPPLWSMLLPSTWMRSTLEPHTTTDFRLLKDSHAKSKEL